MAFILVLLLASVNLVSTNGGADSPTKQVTFFMILHNLWNRAEMCFLSRENDLFFKLLFLQFSDMLQHYGSQYICWTRGHLVSIGWIVKQNIQTCLATPCSIRWCFHTLRTNVSFNCSVEFSVILHLIPERSPKQQNAWVKDRKSAHFSSRKIVQIMGELLEPFNFFLCKWNSPTDS